MNKSYPRPLLDRFFLDEQGRFPSPTIDGDELAAIVIRDVEKLLNSRSSLSLDPDDDSPERFSVPGYGLPDFHHLSPASLDDMWRVAAMVAETLARFEPRLCNVEVIPDDGTGFDQGRLVIHGRIYATGELVTIPLAATDMLEGG